MLLWFAGMALVVVWNVFRDPRLDHRLVVLGVVVAEPLDAPFGGAALAHSAIVCVAVLAVVVALTKRRSVARSRLVAFAIGLLLHLVLDGVWNDAEVFWWPVSGAELGEHDLPVVERGWTSVLLEVPGALALAWFWRRFALGDPRHRRAFLCSGQLAAAGRP